MGYILGGILLLFIVFPFILVWKDEKNKYKVLKQSKLLKKVTTINLIKWCMLTTILGFSLFSSALLETPYQWGVILLLLVQVFLLEELFRRTKNHELQKGEIIAETPVD